MTVARVLVGIASLVVLGTTAGPLAAQTAVPPTLQVPLFPEFDLYGNQFEVVQAYEDDLGHQSMTVGIYDTGASVVTFSSDDQNFLFPFQGQQKIPVIPGAVATADAIGGSLEGQVSQPGRILATGASALTIDLSDIFSIGFSYDLSNAVSVGGLQAFVGTSSGSPNLPSIVGTPINVPSPTNPGGLATILDQTGYTLNLADLDPIFDNIEIQLPDVPLVPSGTSLVPAANTYEAVSIPVSLFGADTTGNPGNDISAAPNPVQNNTAVSYTPTAPGSATQTISNQKFLFDTGAQPTIISPAIAAQLGLTDIDGNPIETPFDVIDVQGAGDSVTGLPGYILDTLTVPRTDGGLIEFTNVPVYVLDVGFGIDGILGMNLFNGADSFIYDPYNVDGPVVSALFLNDRDLESVLEEFDFFGDLDFIGDLVISLLGSRYANANPLVPGLNQQQQVPEPSTLVLALIALVPLAAFLRRHRRAK